MTTVEKMINYAVSTENKTRGELELTRCYHWCAEYITSVIRKSCNAIQAEVTSMSCTQMYTNMSRSSEWYEPDDEMKVGDIIFYNWDHDYDPDGNLDHVGIIVEVTDKFIRTIEGNTEVGKYGSTESRVLRKNRYRESLNFNCTYPDYYMRLTNTQTAETQTTTQQHTNDDFIKAISNIQTALDKLKALYHI